MIKGNLSFKVLSMLLVLALALAMPLSAFAADDDATDAADPTTATDGADTTDGDAEDKDSDEGSDADAEEEIAIVPVETISKEVAYELGEDEDAAYVVAYDGDEIVARSYYANNVVTAKVKEDKEYTAAYNAPTSFTDTEGRWMDQAVLYMAARGIVNGTSDTQYSPDNNVTRGQYVTMLYRMFDLSAEDITDTYVDVTDATAFYYEAANTAKALGITAGDIDGYFHPTANITREDMFTMTYKAMLMHNMVTPATGTTALASFTDTDEISDYAEIAMATLVAQGIAQGSNNELDPQGNSSRGQAAQIMYNVLAADAK